MFTNRQHIRQHLCRMIFICQSIPDRNPGIFCELLHDILTKTAVFNTFEHSSEHARSISDAFLLTDLRSRRIQIGTSHSEVMRGHFEGTTGSCTRLFKNKRNILSAKRIYLNSFFLLLFIFRREVK